MQKRANYLLFTLVFISLLSCSKNSPTESESAIYDASGLWMFTFTQTNIVDGNYIECGRRQVPQRFFEIIQDGNNVSLLDKNGETVNGSVKTASYVFNFEEQENNYDEDYIDFHLEIKLSSDTTCTGTYRMDERTFFTAYDKSFFCITEGTLVGSTF